MFGRVSFVSLGASDLLKYSYTSWSLMNNFPSLPKYTTYMNFFVRYSR